ncbi:MAG TPA: DNA polymerase I, partial [Tissierellaceae bacterium]|nr:DNA polymerase I [Tissierellaceae bacterium]
MEKKPRLFLLDAYALIFRGYYAFIRNPQINSKGQNTSAIMGFVNTLFDLIRREQPDHLAVCFDKDGSAERTELYPEYKAHRDKTPQDILDSVPIIKDILKAMHIPAIELSGVEADDIIGTLSKKAEKEGYQVFMVTSDTDYAQLVSENIFMYRPPNRG